MRHWLTSKIKIYIYRIHFLDFGILFLDHFGCKFTFGLVQTGARGFFDHRQNLCNKNQINKNIGKPNLIGSIESPHLHWFHIQHFCDSDLHNQKIRIVYIHLNWTKQIGYSFVLHRFAIDEIFIFSAATDNNLACDSNLFTALISNWTIWWICVIEYNTNSGFCYTGLSIFKYQFL